MPNYRQKNRGRNKNKNKNRNKQHQQQQPQQQKTQEIQHSERASGATNVVDLSLDPPAHTSLTVESPSSQPTALDESAQRAGDNPKETNISEEVSTSRLATTEEHNVIACDTVSFKPATTTCNKSPSPPCTSESDRKMGNEKSKPIRNQEDQVVDSQPVSPLTPPVTPRQQAKVIVHRIICEDAVAEEKSMTTSASDNRQSDTDGSSASSANRNSGSGPDEVAQRQVKVIVHKIHLEDSENDSANPAVANTAAFSPVHIEEVGDESLTDLEELRSPVVSEVDSAAECEDADSSSEVEAATSKSTSTMTASQREKRKQKRLALESHFLPQMLSPRFLDSISEENSDLSECGDNPLSRSASAENAVTNTPDTQKTQKLNAKFPKSSLDFSKPHKPTLTLNTPSNRCVIREEPVAFAVEARIQEAPDADESCTTLKSFLSPQSELAEMVFINSASSSMTDLNDLDQMDRVSLHSTHSSVAFDLDTDAKDLINKPGTTNNELTSSSLPSSQLATPAESAKSAESLANCTNKDSHFINNNARTPPSSPSPDVPPQNRTRSAQPSRDQPAAPSLPFSAVSGRQSLTDIDDALRLLSDAQARLLETSCDSANTSSSVSSLCADKIAKPPQEVLTENVQNMNTVRDIINSDITKSGPNANGNNNNSSHHPDGDLLGNRCSHTYSASKLARGSPPPPPIPPPPKSHNLDLDPLPLLERNVEQHNGQQSAPPTQAESKQPKSPLPTSSLVRQESLDSHCSDSTTFSQCTAINVGPNQATSSDQASSISDLKSKTTPTEHQAPSVGAADPKKLRLLCAETLAALPYGGEVLEELATLAQHIGEVKAVNVVETHKKAASCSTDTTATSQSIKMPYPPPELPHIDDLRLSLDQTARNVPQRPPSPNAKHPDSWVGLPTSFDPKVLICLSPSQQSYIEKQQQTLTKSTVATTTTSKELKQQPDELLDAHQKFVERRGYHEFTKEQLASIEQEKLAEQQLLQTAAMMKKLRKSLTPPPPQIPPPPVPAKSSETATKAQNLSKRSITATSSATTHASDVTTAAATAAPPITDKQVTGAYCEGEENKHRLLSIIQDTNESQQSILGGQQQLPQPAATETKTLSLASSFENNSRQTTSKEQQQQQEQQSATPQQSKPSTFIVPITLTNGSSDRSYNFPRSSSGNMQSVESSLGEMFPTLGSSNIFDKEHKRFSNIESSTSQPMAVDVQPKRYSSIETHSFESQKRIENGQVVVDYSNSKHDKQSFGGEGIPTGLETKFPTKTPPSSGDFSNLPQPTASAAPETDGHEIMSALKLNNNSSATLNNGSASTTTTTTHSQENSAQNVQRDEVDFAKAQHSEEQQKQNASDRMTALRRGIEDSYEEFRQRAKEAASTTATFSPGAFEVPAAVQTTSNADGTNGHGVISSSTTSTSSEAKQIFHSDHEKLFKEFDDLSKQLHRELETGKSQREQKERSASLFDLNRVQLRHKEQIEEFNKLRHDHMSELEKEIERSMKSRQLRMSSVDRSGYCSDTSNSRSYQIPIQMENDIGYQTTKTMGAGAPPVPEPPRSYQIPVHMSNDPGDDSRFRRAESMFNLNDEGRKTRAYGGNHQPTEDDWSKYASDLGSSENITRPFAREVEICYQRRPGGIRAPRLTASTSDLSYNTHSYDQYNAYNVRRSHAPMLNKAPQQSRPHYGSCYSMIERDPNPKYISTTTRRGTSPAPQPSGFHPIEVSVSDEQMRQRRASLPRELHEQQLKYIACKEEELRTEFERLQKERQRLMEEVNRAQTMPMAQPSPRPHRDSYRCVPKLPTLTEDEVFRQQMAEEWLSKVAEREKRRLQNIIKLSKVHDEESSEHRAAQTNMGDEFLSRVKERRTKLSMPADSDWESGAESHPHNAAQSSETEDVPPVKILEGNQEANLRNLPRHLREFAKFSNHQRDEIEGGHREEHQQEERSQEVTDNSISKAFKKSTTVKTVKSVRAPMLPPDNGGHVIKWHRARGHHQQQHTNDSNGSARPTVDPVISKRSRKQTRFLLPANRRSWSESDLLQEIDQELKLAKGFLFRDGIWSPKNQTPSSSTSNLSEIKSTPPTPPPPPASSSSVIWTPQQSPQLGRKEYRPVRFESPTPRRRIQSTSSEPPLPPWNNLTNNNFQSPNSCTNLSTPTSTVASEQDSTGSISLPGRSTSVSDKIKTFERSASATELYTRPHNKRPHDKARPFCRPNEVIYNVKHEYMSEPETENDRPRKMAQLGRRQYDGIGPMTTDGMPIILRSEVKEPHQHEWYKRLYQTIHKQKHGDDYVIRYKYPRGRTQAKSNGYQSEPEPCYYSDYSVIKYRPVNTQRLQSVSSALNVRSSNDKLYGTLPNPVKSEQNTYKNQPGRIEDYVTGHSSISEKETKKWWDEIMDIFNVQLDQAKLSSRYTEGNLSRALAKESGYTSDSNLILHKKEIPPNSPLSPQEQKQAYKYVQAGGEPPLFGFRKAAPEKSKDYDSPQVPPPPQSDVTDKVSPNRYYESDVNIHFKTPVRQELKSPLSEEELALRQAQQMQKLYQEERRRKYLQELQDMNSRRHTDNFTPSQKSPIPLNRYDDFPADLAPKNLSQIKSVARALYNFQAQNSKELSFKKGDIIYIRRAIDKNWYEGEHNAMIGLFPANYVEIVNRDINQPQQAPRSKPSEGQARAKYNFQAQSAVELSLNKGELVALTRRVDDNWFEGRIANRKGIFPVSYVEVLTDIGAEDIAAKTTTVQQTSTVNYRPSLDALRTNINNEFNTLTRNGVQPPNSILRETRPDHKIDILHVDTSSEPLVYRALYKYRPQNSDELELLEGDIVHVLEKCDDGWYVGTSQRTGCFGTFPGNYVERL
ncbi:uncharacterized protein LOC101892774 isoform X5 [Musca domestica]|uniref:Uncharacterized protein LOC101892774 isoform X5 n=1 Tax=Musca domestica TaxID=7370 RepID=A0ABM3VMP5_MUSDO|nr:uncharacterized protein LOC101892774 isoform X5 [Musca domestica]